MSGEMTGHGRGRGGDPANVGRGRGVRGRGRGTATQRSSAGGCDVGGAVRDQVLHSFLCSVTVKFTLSSSSRLQNPCVKNPYLAIVTIIHRLHVVDLVTSVTLGHEVRAPRLADHHIFPGGMDW